MYSSTYYLRIFFFSCSADPPALHSFPTRRSSDLFRLRFFFGGTQNLFAHLLGDVLRNRARVRLLLGDALELDRSEEHTSELQSRQYLVCRLLLEKKK